MTLVVAPMLLPDFYSWKTYFNPQSNPLLYLLWGFGFAAKYCSAVLILLAVCLYRKHLSFIGLVCVSIFYLWNLATSLFHHEGWYDSFNLMLMCLPILCYALIIKDDSHLRRRMVEVSYRFAVIVVALTLFQYCILPDGLGEIFGQCAYGRMCGNVIGIHADVIVYGLVFMALAILLYLDVRSNLMLVCSTGMTLGLVSFSSSAVGIVVGVIVIISCLAAYACQSHRNWIRLISTLCTPAFITVIFFIGSFFILTIMNFSVVKNLIMHVLHRSADLTGRLAMYQTAISEFKSSWLTGHGYSDRYFLSVLKNNMGQSMAIPHNSFLQVLMASGLIGALCMVLLVSYMTKSMWPVRNRRSILVASCLFFGACIASALFRDLYTARFALLLVLCMFIGERVNLRD